jgi:hypothetical protein
MIPREWSWIYTWQEEPDFKDPVHLSITTSSSNADFTPLPTKGDGEEEAL